MRRWLAIGLLALSLGAGCGGDDGGGSSADEWADDLCSAITTWSESITATARSLGGGNLTEAELRSAVDDFEGATTDFVADVKGLGAPETEAGEEAKQSLDQLADEVEQNVAQIQKAVDNASGASGVVEAVTAVSGALSTMGAELSSTFAELEQLDGAAELERAFEESEPCASLGSDGS